MAITISRGFGGGMGVRSICGAVTGAFMVLGFKYQEEEEEKEARFKTYDSIREFVKRFESLHGTIICPTLLDDLDISTDEGRKEAVERELFKTLCPKFVKDAAQILNELMT